MDIEEQQGSTAGSREQPASSRQRVRRSPRGAQDRSTPDVRARRPAGRVLGGGARSGPVARAAVRGGSGAQVWRPTRDQLELLASLLDGGVRIADALDLVSRAAADRTTRAAVAIVASEVRAGREFGDVLCEVGASRHVSGLVIGGERAGRLSESLRAAAELVAHLERLRMALRAALAYPSIVLAIGLGMTVVIAFAVVPAFERTFIELGGTLPLATRVVVRGAALLRGPAVPGAVSLAMLVWIVRARRRRSTTGAIVGWTLLRGLRTDLDVAVLASLVANAVRSGLTLLVALETATDALVDPRNRRTVTAAAIAVRAGRSHVEPDALGPLLLPAERELLAVAERTGALAAQWARVAEMRHARVAAFAARLATTLEPVLVLGVGLLVGGIVLALYLPTFEVLDLVSTPSAR